MFIFPRSKADKLSVQPYLIRFLRRLINLMLLLSVGLGNFVLADMVYVANLVTNDVKVIDTNDNNRTVETIAVESYPYDIVSNPSSTRVYVANQNSNTVSVIDTSDNSIVSTIAVGTYPVAAVVNTEGTRVYVANSGDNSISVIDTINNSVVSKVAVGTSPYGVAVNPLGTRVYVTNWKSNSVSVVDTSLNKVMETIAVGTNPSGIVVNRTGTRVYVTNAGNSNNISVIDTSTNKIETSIVVGTNPLGIAINPAGTFLYVTNYSKNNVSVINTSNNSVVSTIAVGTNPYGIAINPSGTRVYVANWSSSNISVIDTANNSVVDTIAMGSFPHGIVVTPSVINCKMAIGIPATECQNLISLYNSTGGANWVNKTGWNVTNAPCSWFGVTCSGGHVTDISLIFNGLKGSIPNLNFPSLRLLILEGSEGSKLSGSVPNFSNSPNLTYLSLGGNQLSGSIPNFNLPNLKELSLSSNKLSGSVPNFNLPNLQYLNLAGNQLSGSVPNFNLPNLQKLLLDSNQLCSILPNFTAFNLSNLNTATFNNNCGLYAADTAQETALNTKDAQWKTKNPSCPATPDPACTANFDVTVTKTGNGQVSVGGKYAVGATVNLTATPDANSIFTGWTPAPCANSFVMPANNLTCTANFAACTYTISPATKTHTADKETGIITITPSAANCPAVTPTEDSEWLTVTSINGNTVNYQVLANTTTTARVGNLTIAGQKFTVTQAGIALFKLTLKTEGKGTISPSVAEDYLAGTAIKLTATADINSTFIGWNPAPCAASFTMPTNNLTCTAIFSTCSYTLDSLKKSHTENLGEGSIAVTTQAGCPIEATSEVPWMKTAVVGNAVNYTVEKNTDVERKGTLSIVGQQVEITQAVGRVEVIVNKAGNGEGIVNGGGIYPVGTPIKLTATATAAKSTFVGWTGVAPCGASFTIPANSPNPLTCTANFSTCTYTLGGISRIHSPAEESGSVIVTTENGCAIPSQSTVPWIIVSAPTGNTVNYKVTANTTAAERKGTLTIAGQSFAITQPGSPPPPTPTFKLTVNKGGSCTGTAMEENHKEGDTVALSTPSCANHIFTEWTPASCATSFKMPANSLICTANFSACTYALSTLKVAHSAKSETGNITVNTQGNCPVTAQSYVPWITITSPSANSVSYTVEANTGAERVGTMSIAGQTVTVTQAAVGVESFTVNINVSGSGTGSVTGQGSYPKGTSVNLAAIPASGATFVNWSGDCLGTANPYKLTVDSNKNCSAIFNSNPKPTLQVTTAGNATFSPTIQTVNSGQTATFSITALGTPIKSVTGCNGVWNGSNSYTTGAITKDCVITVITAELDGKYTVTAIQTSHGKIAPDSRVAEAGKAAYFTITPDDSYEIDAVTVLSGGCKGTQQGSEYIIATVTENCQITATFKPKGYSITILGTPGRGSTEPGILKIKHGESASFTTTAATGYEVGGVSGCNTTLQSENVYKTGTITSGCDITVSFKKIGEYTITTKTTGNGTISPQTISLERGSSAIFNLTPGEGYAVESISGCDGVQNAESYTTKAVTADCNIAVAFKIKQYTLQTEVRPKGAGTMSLPSNTIEHGKTMDFTVVPTAGYEVELTRGCKGEQILPSNSIYTTRPIVDNCTLLADLKLKKYEIKLTYQFKNSPPSIVNFDPIEHGQSTGFDILDAPNEEIESVIGCGGRLEGKHYTTAAITTPCEITVYYKASPQSQCTQYSAKETPQVIVPCVNLVNQSMVYTGQMKLIPAIPPAELSFEVLGDSLKALDKKVTPTNYCAVFPADSQHPTRLRLNCVKIENEYYWAELDLINHPSLIQFNLVNYGVMDK